MFTPLPHWQKRFINRKNDLGASSPTGDTIPFLPDTDTLASSSTDWMTGDAPLQVVGKGNPSGRIDKPEVQKLRLPEAEPISDPRCSVV